MAGGAPEMLPDREPLLADKAFKQFPISGRLIKIV